MHIRTAETNDLDTVAALFDQYRVHYGKPSDISLARAFVGQRTDKAESVIFVADAPDSGLVGFVQLYPSFSSISAARTYVLNDLFVAPTHRRRGVARLLLEAASRFAQEAGAVQLSLSTTIGNQPAQALYVSLGWARDLKFHHFTLTLGSDPSRKHL